MEEKFVEDIANKISDGIIILNSKDKVIYANNYVRKALSIESIDLEEIEVYKIKDADKSTIGLRVKDIEYDGIGEILETNLNSYNYKSIVILNKICKKDKCNNITKNNVWGEIKLESIIGESQAMNNVKRKIIKIANSISSVLITGESGTGKELLQELYIIIVIGRKSFYCYKLCSYS